MNVYVAPPVNLGEQIADEIIALWDERFPWPVYDKTGFVGHTFPSYAFVGFVVAHALRQRGIDPLQKPLAVDRPVSVTVVSSRHRLNLESDLLRLASLLWGVLVGERRETAGSVELRFGEDAKPLSIEFRGDCLRGGAYLVDDQEYFLPGCGGWVYFIAHEAEQVGRAGAVRERAARPGILVKLREALRRWGVKRRLAHASDRFELPLGAESQPELEQGEGERCGGDRRVGPIHGPRDTGADRSAQAGWRSKDAIERLSDALHREPR